MGGIVLVMKPPFIFPPDQPLHHLTNATDHHDYLYNAGNFSEPVRAANSAYILVSKVRRDRDIDGDRQDRNF